jgi:hypothetical protein
MERLAKLIGLLEHTAMAIPNSGLDPSLNNPTFGQKYGEPLARFEF